MLAGCGQITRGVVRAVGHTGGRCRKRSSVWSRQTRGAALFDLARRRVRGLATPPLAPAEIDAEVTPARATAAAPVLVPHWAHGGTSFASLVTASSLLSAAAADSGDDDDLLSSPARMPPSHAPVVVNGPIAPPLPARDQASLPLSAFNMSQHVTALSSPAARRTVPWTGNNAQPGHRGGDEDDVEDDDEGGHHDEDDELVGEALTPVLAAAAMSSPPPPAASRMHHHRGAQHQQHHLASTVTTVTTTVPPPPPPAPPRGMHFGLDTDDDDDDPLARADPMDAAQGLMPISNVRAQSRRGSRATSAAGSLRRSMLMPEAFQDLYSPTAAFPPEATGEYTAYAGGEYGMPAQQHAYASSALGAPFLAGPPVPAPPPPPAQTVTPPPSQSTAAAAAAGHAHAHLFRPNGYAFPAAAPTAGDAPPPSRSASRSSTTTSTAAPVLIPSVTKKSTTLCKSLPPVLSYPSNLIPLDAPIQHKAPSTAASASATAAPSTPARRGAAASGARNVHGMAELAAADADAESTIDLATSPVRSGPARKRARRAAAATATAPTTLPARSAAAAAAASASAIPETHPDLVDLDSMDPRDAKRIRNTLSARKSRARKAAKITYLEQRVNALEEMVARANDRIRWFHAELMKFEVEVPHEMMVLEDVMAGVAMDLDGE
ncbi:hypothetical protein AMAG_06482 [Allomyces macrogynus ATCC 38327]|uniref:BZIP domain-containing protein n=1 Tax=Allomyces macrogynus (strain ATCC 38327) TaxID=578462 RepID=A0A0L0SGN6_ALLM3|nr:hypothetical protein AMAG_06482 [Allomyces macrogynus ATCC 38327]|eukprot:KNE61676.1 hypothetical protein AMAG_06482 [Allomyces macrogynus ATCC 38327]